MKRALLCRCTVDGRAGAVGAAEERLRAAGWSLSSCDDCCALVQEDRLPEVDLVIAACHERGLQALLAQLDAAPPAIGLMGLDDDELGRRLDTVPEGDGAEPAGVTASQSAAWFPVIDGGRCNDCGQCLDFCLFDVFRRDGRSVRVLSPANCKPDCPACARVCPREAIVFPKHRQAPINGAPAEDGAVPADLQDLLTGDLHHMLRQRSAGGERFSLDRDQREALALRRARLAAHMERGKEGDDD